MSSTGTQLNKVKLAPQYDCIIIGAGMSGLACAAILAMHGENVLVLESHYAVGGYTHTFKKKGFEFNAGLHFDGQVGYSGHPTNSVFNLISDQRIQWHAPTPVLEQLYFGPDRDEYLIKTGLASFIDSVAEKFPEERKNISNYVDLVRKVESKMSWYFSEKVFPQAAGSLLAPVLRPPFLKYSKQVTADVFKRLTKNEKLISVLNGSWHEFGVPPSASSFAGHALYRSNTIGGTFFPIGGTAGLGNQVVPTIERFGGTVALSAPVRRVLIRNGTAHGVELENGEKIQSKRVISSIGAKGTFSRLLDDEHVRLLPFHETLRQLRSTCSAAGIFLGLNGTNEELNLPPYPSIIFHSYDHQHSLDEMHRHPVPNIKFPYVYMISQSARDPAWQQKHPGKSSLLVCAYDLLERHAAWSETSHKDRPTGYLEYKQKMTEYLMEKVHERHPQLKGKVEIADAFTPMTVRQYGNHPSGEIYGLSQDPARFEQKWLRPDTSIRNFFLTGVDVTTSSIVGAAMSGAITALNILGPLRAHRLLSKMLPWKYDIRSPEYYR